jgi:hypothetical protein
VEPSIETYTTVWPYYMGNTTLLSGAGEFLHRKNRYNCAPGNTSIDQAGNYPIAYT